MASPVSCADIGGEQALLDEMLDQRPCLGGDLREPSNAPARGAGVGIDAGQPGDQTAAEQRQPCEAVLRDRRVRVRSLEGALDRRLDRAFDPSELVVVRELEMTAGVVLVVEPLQREGEQRQRILGAARLDVGEQRIDQAILDLERACAFRPAVAPAP